jgi:hypothetical protein
VAATGQSPRPTKNDRCYAENQPTTTQNRQSQIIGAETITFIETRGRQDHRGDNSYEYEKQRVVEDRDAYPADRRAG